jgi:hypothetical protein
MTKREVLFVQEEFSLAGAFKLPCEQNVEARSIAELVLLPI